MKKRDCEVPAVVVTPELGAALGLWIEEAVANGLALPEVCDRLGGIVGTLFAVATAEGRERRVSDRLNEKAR